MTPFSMDEYNAVIAFDEDHCVQVGSIAAYSGRAYVIRVVFLLIYGTSYK